MVRRTLIGTAVALAAGLAGITSAAAAEPTDEYVVRVDPGSAGHVARELSGWGADVTAELTNAIGVVGAELTDGQVRALSTVPGVLGVEAVTPVAVYDAPDPVGTEGLQVAASSIITQYGATWGLDRLDQATLPLDGRYVYDSHGGAGVRVYVVDTGISPNPDFGGRLAAGYDGVGDGIGTADCAGHGTHVAGTAASTTFGVAKQATVVPVRVAGCTGKTDDLHVIAGLDWIVANHPAGTPGVVNISMGGPQSTSLNAAVAAVVDHGLTVAVAAGNDAANACGYSPASEPDALTVGATTAADARADYSNVGSCVDLFAPGSSIPSLYYADPSSVAIASGTSMASPHVAGVAALLLGAWPTATPAQVTTALLDGARSSVVTDPQGSPNLLLSDVLPPPGSPADLQTSATALTGTVSWSPAAGLTATSYRVAWRVAGASAWSQKSTGSTTLKLTGLEPTTTYDVTVTAVGSGGDSAPTAGAFTTTEIPPPDAPTGLGATPGVDQLHVSWTAPDSEGVSGYTVEHSTDGSTWTAQAASQSSATVTGLTPGTAYQLRVAAIAGGKTGAYALTSLSTRDLPGPPQDAAVARATTTTADLTWAAPATDADVVTGYRVQWSTDGVSWTPGVVVTSTHTTVTALAAGTAYQARITALAGSWDAGATEIGLVTALFTDVATDAPFYGEVTWLANQGITGGYADGGFHPTLAVTREAMAAFLYRFAGEPAFTPPPSSPFTDVATSSPFYTEICWLADQGISGGYADGGFHPGAAVSRQAMAAFLYRFAGQPAFTPPTASPFTDLATSSAFFLPVTWLADAGITGGYADGGFHPGAAVSRQAMAAFLYRYAGPA